MREDTLDPEWLAFRAGLKPALRLSLPPNEAAERARKLTEQGYFVTAADREVCWPGQAPQTILYVAASAETAKALRAAEACVFPGDAPKESVADCKSAHRDMGVLLGFPGCCVDAFLERIERGVTQRRSGGEADEDFVAAEDAVARTSVFYGRLNDLRRREGLWILPFFPCRYDCPVAMAYADAVFAQIRTVHSAAAERLWAELAKPVQLQGLTIPFDRF